MDKIIAFVAWISKQKLFWHLNFIGDQWKSVTEQLHSLFVASSKKNIFWMQIVVVI